MQKGCSARRSERKRDGLHSDGADVGGWRSAVCVAVAGLNTIDYPRAISRGIFWCEAGWL